MEITEFKFVREQPETENQTKLGMCEITLDHSVILDEVQRRPDLFPVMRSMIDQKRTAGRFVLLGSASRRRTVSTSAGSM